VQPAAVSSRPWEESGNALRLPWGENVRNWTITECGALALALAHPDARQAWREAISLLASWELVINERTSLLTEMSEQALEPTLRPLVQAMLRAAWQRREESEAARATAERLALLSSASFEGLLIHEQGMVVDSNQRLSELVGYESSELLGLGTISLCVAPEDVPLVYHKMQTGYEGTYVVTGVRKGGTKFRAELQSKQGQLGERPVRVVAVRDVTERERMTQLLRESESRLRDLAETVFDLTVMSRDGIMVAVSGPLLEKLGYSESDFVGHPVLDFVAATAQPITEAAVKDGRKGAYQSVLHDHYGEHVPVEIVGVQSTLEGQPTRIAGIRDLRRARHLELEKQALQQRLERSQRLDSLGLLASGIAHDFNNLLVGILGNAELLSFDLTQKEAPEMLRGITMAAQKAADLTARMLAYAGKGEIGPPQMLDLTILVRELAHVVSRRQKTRSHLDLQIKEGCLVMGDRAALTQVFLNLLTNAVDATSTSGTVRVHIDRINHLDARWDSAVGAVIAPGDWILAEVRDTGRGMDAATKDRIFEPFFSTKPAGHGLGLAACVGLVERHRGALHVESEPGLGTCFSVLLPAANVMHDELAEVAHLRAAPCSVMVVDDELAVRRQMERSLRLRGFTVTEAAGGRACLDLVERVQPDVMLIDLGMPDLPGVEVVQELRLRGVQVPVVLTSGYLDSALEKQLAPGSFQAFLRKPYGVTELVAAIDQARHPHVTNRGW